MAFVDPLAYRLAGLAEALVLPLFLSFPLAVVTFWWLPRRSRFALAWLALWPIGMLLQWGFGNYLLPD